MITDFSLGKPPAIIKYCESLGRGVIFQGWLEINDTKIAGDFMGLGNSQIIFFNRSLNGIQAEIVDFTNKMPIAY